MVKMLLNHGWSFSLDGSKSEPVGIPHDWLIGDARNHYKTGTGRYTRILNMKAPQTNADCCTGDGIKDKKISLRFDGVYMDSTLRVNGKTAGEWKYGYTTFEFDITDYLTQGDNEIELTVNYDGQSSRWYTGAGIYRDVWFIVRNACHFAPDGIYITTAFDERDKKWSWEVDAEVICEGRLYNTGTGFKRGSTEAAGKPGNTEAESRKENAAGEPGNTESAGKPGNTEAESRKENAEAEGKKDNAEGKENKTGSAVQEGIIPGGAAFKVRHTLLDEKGIKVDNTQIKPWDIGSPQLYTVRSELYRDGKIIDTVSTRIGFRTIRYSCDEGFFLNGRRTKIYGVCQHHDLGPLGAAFYIDAARRQLDILRAMGVNAIRTAHNPPAPGLMELCDEMGFLVMSELTDIWRNPKTPGDYARFFDEWVERDCASWIRRDRNHPCIIMWSTGNEINDTHVSFEDGSATLTRLQKLVKKHDPKGHAPSTLSSNYMTWENTQKCVDNMMPPKLIGYNYTEHLYAEHHKKYPDWIIFGGETLSTLQSRGVYHFPLSRSVLADDDLQCSALGNTTTSWGARNVEGCIADDLDTSFSPGMFIWSGIDYLGEPTPYHTKNCYFGQADTACFEKDTYYIFKAAWTDYKKDPFVYIFPYWDFSPGQIIDVRVCSNAPEVLLYLDDKEIGRAGLRGGKGLTENPGAEDPDTGGDINRGNSRNSTKTGDPGGKGRWIATWQIPYKAGTLRAIAIDENEEIIAEAQRCSFGDVHTLKSESVTYGELDFITITALDGQGRTVENANCRVHVSTNPGAGISLLALDNGDSTDFESYHASSRRLFNGKLLAIVKHPPGVEPDVGIYIDPDDIPVRKIEIVATNEDKSGFTAKILPENASYDDIEWRLTDAGGIDSPMGELVISDDKRQAKLIKKGDGSGYIRCSVRNGRDHPMLIFVLEVEVTGMGRPFLDPYKFLSAGLYNACNHELTSGNERGVATMRLGDTHVGFKNVDFGTFGSDEIAIWLFPLSHEPFDFEIYEGMPDEGGGFLYKARYDKGSVWNTYIETAYKLPRRLKGVTTLCLVFHDKVHIKGFVFTKPCKAYALLAAADNDTIYGDSFRISGSCVEDIGNNVSIIFSDMDFEPGTGSVTLRWRSDRQNPVRIDFENSNSETVTSMLTLPAFDTYAEKTFKLGTPLSGSGKVSLVFLPGCKLDLESIRFERP